MERNEAQTEIILREQWINLAGSDATAALMYGASAEEIMRCVHDAALQRQSLPEPADKKGGQLKRIRRAAAEAIRRGAEIEHIKRRIAVSLWREGALSDAQASKLMGVDRSDFRKICDDLAGAQKEALRLTVDPETFHRCYR